MISVEEARAMVLSGVSTLPTERVSLLEALGRVLAEDALSDIDVAPFDNTAMDGYAVRSEDTGGASEDTPVVLRVLDHIAAGSVPTHVLQPGTASRIMTGAPVPEGADAIVKIEDTEGLEAGGGAGGTVAIKRPATRGDHVRFRGEEVREGQVILSAGEVISPAAVGLLASTGNVVVSVHRRPRVAILPTGDELVDTDERPGPGKIRDSNSLSLAALVLAAGGIPVVHGIVRDDEATVRSAFLAAAADADVVVSSGGVSVGDFDFAPRVLAEIGSVTFHKVNMRPGGAQTYGVINGVPYFGLPGNPTSAYMGFEMFARPMLRLMQGISAIDRPVVRAVLAEGISKKPGRRQYLRARLEPITGRDDCVVFSVVLTGSQSSALMTAMHKANCLLVLPGDGREYPEGTIMDCLRIDVDESVGVLG